ncbi:MAG: NADH-quinone oxidoreductase subunit NuoE [Parasporobacterium sp.]|nr:NADH-quinone oxidoreductase subunit NuoE [Parasporobacterium sp.]
MSIEKKELLEILNAYPAQQRYCLAIMQDMQKKYNYIPREGMEMLADYLSCPLSSLYSMATFYKALSLNPKGKHIIKLCDGTACHIRGSSSLLDGVKRTLGISDGETTEDGMFSLELVNCLGSCALAPVMVVDETYHGKVAVDKLSEILDSYRKEDDPDENR